MRLSEPLRRYFVTVALAGLIGLAYFAVQRQAVDFRLTLLVGLLVAYSEWSQQILPSGVGLSISASAVLSSMLLFGAPTAEASLLIGCMLVAVARDTKPLVVAFNIGIWTLSLLAAHLVSAMLPGDSQTTLYGLGPVFLTYEATSALIVSRAAALARPARIATVLVQHFVESALPWFGALLATVVIVRAGQGWGVAGTIAAIAVVTLLQTFFTRWGLWLRGRAIDRVLRRLKASDYGHQPRARQAVHYAAAVASELGLDAEQQRIVLEAALLHDVAMESIRAGVLSDPAVLSPEERMALRRHVEVAADEIAQVADMSGVAEAVRHHHEGWSGGGYPAGLAGERVPVASRILSVVDTYLALAEPLPYKHRIPSPEDGIAAITSERGKRLWPPAVDALRAVVAREVAQDTLVREGARQMQLQATVDSVVGSMLRARRGQRRFGRSDGPEAHRWRALHEFSRTVNSSLSTAEVADIMLAAVTRLSTAGGLVAVRDEEGRYIVRAVRRAGESLLGMPLEPLDVETLDAIAEGRAIAKNLRQTEGWGSPFARRGLSYGRLVPACWNGRTVAILLLASNRPASDAELELAEMASSQAALALSNASLFEERERRLRELHELHQITDAILEHMKTAVLLFDDQKVLRLANREARRIFAELGLGALEAGATATELASTLGVAGDALEDLSARTRQAEASLDCGEWTFRGPHGEAQVTMTLSPLRGVSGSADGGVVVVCHDISEHVRLRAEVERRERLAAVGQLAASAAHEIRNPLTAIKGFLQILHGDPTPDRVAEYLPIVLSELHRIETLTGDMLLLARPPMRAGAFCDLAAEITQVIRLVAAKAEASGVVIAFRADGAPSGVPVEPPRARQVLLNLMQNALDAMPNGGRLEIVLTGDDAGSVVLSVTDTGPGIKAAVRERIFEPFVTTKANGTGLGLATSASIVHAAGGRIEVEDPPQGGARFVITWPRAAPTSEASAPSASPLPHVRAAGSPGTGTASAAAGQPAATAEGGSPNAYRWVRFDGTGAPGPRL